LQKSRTLPMADTCRFEMHLSDNAISTVGFHDLAQAFEENDVFPPKDPKYPDKGPLPVYVRLEGNYIEKEAIQEKIDSGVFMAMRKSDRPKYSAEVKVRLLVREDRDFAQKKGNPPLPEDAPAPKRVHDYGKGSESSKGGKGGGGGWERDGGWDRDSRGKGKGKDKDRGKDRGYDNSCADFRMGKCKRDNCKFSHDQGRESGRIPASSRGWQQGQQGGGRSSYANSSMAALPDRGGSYEKGADRSTRGSDDRRAAVKRPESWGSYDRGKSSYERDAPRSRHSDTRSSDYNGRGKDAPASRPTSSARPAVKRPAERYEEEVKRPRRDDSSRGATPAKGGGKSGKSGAEKSGKSGGARGGGKSGTLPHPWEKHWSKEHNLHYYWNSKNGESRWEAPK